MLRFTVRLISLLLLFMAFSGVAKADSFQIVFSGQFSGTGQFTTNGTCTVCTPGAGLLTWVVGIGPDTGASAFDIVDDGIATATITYNRTTNTFLSQGTFSSENPGDLFVLSSNGTWVLNTVTGSHTGTYVVTRSAVAEPPLPLLLLLPAIVLVGLKARRRDPINTSPS